MRVVHLRCLLQGAAGARVGAEGGGLPLKDKVDQAAQFVPGPAWHLQVFQANED